MRRFIDRVLRLIYERGFFALVREALDRGINVIIRKIVRAITDVDNNKIIFLGFSGNYDCNPKYICQELMKKNADVKIVWVIYDNTDTSPGLFPDNIKFTVRDTYDCYKQLCSAKVIVDNGVSTAWLKYKKKKSQCLIETWHGSIGIKKFGRGSNKDPYWLSVAEKEGKMTDYIISNSNFEDDVYRDNFWKNTPIWKFGHARNDVFYLADDKKKEIKDKVYSWYDLDPDVHICLYGPTFRDDGDMSPYVIDYDKLTETLKKRFGGDWVVLTRFHFKTKKFFANGNARLPQNVIDATNYPDIYELLSCTDVGITDYSSWICEYMLSRKPGFTFATDIDSYATTNRSFFIPLSDYPFPFANNENDLFSNIASFDSDKYVADCNAFLVANGSVDDGHASEKVVAEIMKLLGK